MERFLKQVEPIIKAQAKRFKPYIKGWEFEDLMQEGMLSALLALKKWKSAGKRKKAGIFSWTKIYVVNRFKELSKNGHFAEILYEDLENAVPADAIVLHINNFIASKALCYAISALFLSFFITQITLVASFRYFSNAFTTEVLKSSKVGKNLQ